MEYYNLLIFTKNKLQLSSNYDHLILSDDFTFIDESHILVNDKTLEFTYLIYSNEFSVNYPTNSFILMEDNIPVTNFLHQTTLENIYYINNDSVESILEIINEN